MAGAAGHEERMLVDGELIGADSGKTFDNVNPATEEVLGRVADASDAEMGRAIDAARRAFDETDWSTNRARRTECLSQLQEALEKEREDLREELILEVGCPRMTTHANQLDIPLDAALRYPITLIDEFAWRTDLAGAVGPQGSGQHAPGLEGAGRRRRRHRAVELPVGGHPQQARAGPRNGQHGRAQAGARHAVERHAAGPPGGRTDRLPQRGAQRRDVVRPPRRRGADAVAQGRPDLLHRVDRGGQADHGEGCGHAEAGVPRAGRQVGHHRAGRRRLRRRGAVRRGRVLPRRPGVRHPDPDAAPPLALRRRRRDPHGHPLLRGLRRPAATGRGHGPGHLGHAAGPGARLYREGRAGGGDARRGRRPARAISPRDGSWSRRSSPTWTTP